MYSTADIEKKLKELKPKLMTEYNVSNIGYFGSYSSGEQTESSDLDLLVEFSQPIGWRFFTLERFLEQTLGISIDMVTSNSLKDRTKNHILNNVRYV